MYSNINPLSDTQQAKILSHFVASLRSVDCFLFWVEAFQFHEASVVVIGFLAVSSEPRNFLRKSSLKLRAWKGFCLFASLFVFLLFFILTVSEFCVSHLRTLIHFDFILCAR